MNPFAQLLGQQGIDQALPLDAVQPPEFLRDDLDPEMSLSAGAIPGVTEVLLRFVDHVKPGRSQAGGQFVLDAAGDLHRGGLAHCIGKRRNCAEPARFVKQPAGIQHCLHIIAARGAQAGDRSRRRMRLTGLASPGIDAPTMSTLDVHAAAQSGRIDDLMQLIDAGHDVNARNNPGETPLMLAAARGAREAVELLLARGAAVDAATPAGNTALMFAAARGQADVVELLVAKGASSAHQNRFGLGPTDWARWAADPDAIRARLRS